jgi:hypothetical protein
MHIYFRANCIGSVTRRTEMKMSSALFWRCVIDQKFIGAPIPVLNTKTEKRYDYLKLKFLLNFYHFLNNVLVKDRKMLEFYPRHLKFFNFQRSLNKFF